jgi:hypothetical protein
VFLAAQKGRPYILPHALFYSPSRFGFPRIFSGSRFGGFASVFPCYLRACSENAAASCGPQAVHKINISRAHAVLRKKMPFFPLLIQKKLFKLVK